MVGQGKEKNMKEDKERDRAHLMEVTEQMGRSQLRVEDCIKVDGESKGFESMKNRLADMMKGRPAKD